MSEASASFPRHVSLDELIAFNQEIVLLAKAGVPLDEALVDAAEDHPGRVGRISLAVGERLSAGQPLEQVLHELPELFSPAYAAVAAAGIRSGRLPAALECLGATLRRLAELQHTLRLALIYPVLVACLAHLFFVVSLIWLAPTTAASFAAVLGAEHVIPRTLHSMHDAAIWWAMLPPLIVLAIMLIIAISLRSSQEYAPLKQRLLFRGQTAAFCEILAMLVEHAAPIDEALELAGRCSGQQRLRDSAERLADVIRQGRTPSGISDFPHIPPVVVCLLTPGRTIADVALRLRRQADAERRRVQRRLEQLQYRLPATLVLLIGCTAVVAFACWSLWPLAYLIWELVNSLRVL